MGLPLFGGHSECRSGWTRPEKKIPNPNPRNFEILDIASVGRFVIARIHYPDCTNFEGNKILVFQDTTPNKIQKLKEIDPHFCDDNKHISPIARFLPTKEGFEMAVKFCKSME